MITGILLAGLAAAGICGAARGLSENTRGLVCWTAAALSLGLSAVIFFGGSDGFVAEPQRIWTGLCALGALVALTLLIELVAPSKRFRKKDKAEYDPREAERALNLVFVICAAVLSAAAAAASAFNEELLTGLCIIAAAAISVRQLSFFLYCAKTDSARALTDKQRRENILKGMSRGNRGL